MGNIAKYLEKLTSLLKETQVTNANDRQKSIDEAVDEFVKIVLTVKSNAKKIITIGNGGSAAIASHLQTDFANAIKVRALIFTEPSLLTCLSNDFGYGEAFDRQAALWVEPDDLMIAISSSGKSANVLKAVEQCLAKGGSVITFTGFKPDNPLRTKGSLNFYIAEEHYGYVEAAHSVLAHYLTDCVLMTTEEK
jgi:D-sedoheptulose 7-phosphate isomerase